jgi:hypothetical protein
MNRYLQSLLLSLSFAMASIGMAVGCAHQTTRQPIGHFTVSCTGCVGTEVLSVSASLHVVAKHENGRVFYDNDLEDLRTTGGADWQANVMGTTGAQPASGTWIAATNDGTAPAAGDCAAGSVACTLTSEIVSNGLSRKQATYSHTNGTASYTLQTTFTATGTQAVQKFGLFNASSSGTMIFEGTITQVTLNNTDTLTVSWTVTY